jgi:hypothetical protein
MPPGERGNLIDGDWGRMVQFHNSPGPIVDVHGNQIENTRNEK